ncbi:MAG: hypothetical protein IH594_15005 [Bacteroidales bacterium]|nr:hypothetical protein [Bacteroidales bacterium]
MGSICGIIYKNENAKEEHIKKMLSSMSDWKPDYTGFTCHENIALGVHVLYSMTFSPFEKQPWESDRYVIVYDGRFDMDVPVLLHPSENEDTEGHNPKTGDLNGENESYKRMMLDYLQRNLEQEKHGFKGDFALAAWDKKQKKLIGIRDHLGTRPFYYTETSSFFAFATEMKALFSLPGVGKIPDEQWIADSLSTVQSEKYRTPYTNIYRLQPAHTLCFDGEKTILEKYWDLKSKPEWENLTEVEAIKIFREKISLAVERRVKNAVSIGSELSGGLDSSGVTALAYQLIKDSGKKFVALSHGFSEKNLGKYFPFEDEREFSLSLKDFTGIKDHVFCTAEGYGVVNALKKTQNIQSGPIQQGYSIFADSLYDEAQKREVRVLLSGFGGDEGVTSKGGGFIQELANQKKWSLLKDALLRHAGRTVQGRIKAIIKYLALRYSPGFFIRIRKIWSKEDWRISKWKAFALNPDFEKKMSVRERYFEMVGFPDDPDVRARQYKRILHNHVSQRFESSFLAALYRRMEYAYPLWDIDLVEFFYSLPSHLKVHHGVNRYIYREAMKGIIPEKIRTRNDKTGTTVPTVLQRFVHDYSAITELIEKSVKQNPSRYLDYEKLRKWQERIRDRALNDKLPANPGAFFNSLQLILWLREESNLKT